MSRNLVRLTADDAERYVRIRRIMLEAAPWAFAASPEDDNALDPAHVATMMGVENAILAIEAAATAGLDEPMGRPLVAVAGILRQRQSKFAHRASVWGVFVDPAYRVAVSGEMSLPPPSVWLAPGLASTTWTWG